MRHARGPSSSLSNIMPHMPVHIPSGISHTAFDTYCLRVPDVNNSVMKFTVRFFWSSQES